MSAFCFGSEKKEKIQRIHIALGWTGVSRRKVLHSTIPNKNRINRTGQDRIDHR
jgi:hypothetical protein